MVRDTAFILTVTTVFSAQTPIPVTWRQRQLAPDGFRKVIDRNVRVKVFMIDACAEKIQARAITRLEPPSIEELMSSEKGFEVVYFAMGEGTLSYETSGGPTSREGGYMTKALLRHMETAPNVETMFRNVRQDLAKQSVGGSIMIPPTKSTLTSHENWAFNPNARKPIADTWDDHKSDSEDSDNTDGNSCVVCMSEQRTQVFIPCGHVCCCEDCAKEMMDTNAGKCPTCRQVSTGHYKIFHS